MRIGSLIWSFWPQIYLERDESCTNVPHWTQFVLIQIQAQPNIFIIVMPQGICCPYSNRCSNNGRTHKQIPLKVCGPNCLHKAFSFLLLKYLSPKSIIANNYTNSQYFTKRLLSKIYTFSLNKMLLYVFLCVYMTCPLYQLTFSTVYSFTFRDLIYIKF